MYLELSASKIKLLIQFMLIPYLILLQLPICQVNSIRSLGQESWLILISVFLPYPMHSAHQQILSAILPKYIQN